MLESEILNTNLESDFLYKEILKEKYSQYNSFDLNEIIKYKSSGSSN